MNLLIHYERSFLCLIFLFLIIQHALFEISQNQSLTNELVEKTEISNFFKNRFDNAFIHPYFKFLSIEPILLTKEHSELILRSKVFYRSVEEEIEKLKDEGFPLELIKDEDILFALEKNQIIQQEVSNYILFWSMYQLFWEILSYVRLLLFII